MSDIATPKRRRRQTGFEDQSENRYGPNSRTASPEIPSIAGVSDSRLPTANRWSLGRPDGDSETPGSRLFHDLASSLFPQRSPPSDSRPRHAPGAFGSV